MGFSCMACDQCISSDSVLLLISVLGKYMQSEALFDTRVVARY